ncbi:MAG: Obg family GTPase CgtA, partial [bacterium]
VTLVANSNVGTLLDFKGAKKIKAPSGDKGGGSDRKGASGEDVEIHVPIGTLVFEIPFDFEDEEDSGLEPQEEGAEPELIADLTEHGQRFVVARGGMGGLGNARFKTSTRQAPDFATPGKSGQSRLLRLSLKLMADVGLIGFPNAGKSTLLSRISAARPRVANYPFTTLVPSLGVVERDERRIVVADIPGLIEGASDGAGLGHQFLRHVERTRVLVHLLDLEAMLVEGRDLLADYDAIRHELGRYQADLLERQEIVVLSKGDLIHDESLVADLLASLKERGIKVRRISSAASQGLDNLLVEAFEAVEAEREADRLAEEAAAAKASAKSGQVGKAGAKR